SGPALGFTCRGRALGLGRPAARVKGAALRDECLEILLGRVLRITQPRIAAAQRRDGGGEIRPCSPDPGGVAFRAFVQAARQADGGKSSAQPTVSDDCRGGGLRSL